MMRLSRWIGCFALACTLPGEAEGQDGPPVRWSATAGAAFLDLGRVNGWAVGPTAGIRYHPGRRVALGGDLTALVGSSGFYQFHGGQAALGVVLVPWTGTVEPELGAGVTGVLGGDSDGSIGNAAGLFTGGGVTWWLQPRLGVRVRATWHLWHTGITGTGATGAVTLRW